MSGWMSVYRNMITALQTHTAAISRFQEEVSSGSRINRPSDDPNAAWRVMNLQDQVRSLDAFNTNLQTVTGNLEQSSSILQEISDQLISAKQLMTQAASGTGGQTAQAPIAEEINSILEQVVSLANTKSTSGYLFGGDKGEVAPYAIERTGGSISRITYQGSSLAGAVPVAPGVSDMASLVGSDIFSSSERKTPVFLGQTGAAAGSGTSNIIGSVWLSVQHVQTQYLDTSATGVLAGNSSASGDTIVGKGHSVTIDGVAKTIKLDDGPAVSYTVGGADLQLHNAAGDKAYVNVSGINPALAGQVKVAITASAKLSIGSSANSVTVTNFPTNMAVTDSQTGKVLYVNAQGLTRIGAEPVTATGTFDMFQSLIDERDLLKNTRNIDATTQSDLLTKAADAMDVVIHGTTEHLAAVGSRLQAMDSLKTSLSNLKSGATDQINTVEEADVAQLAADLAREQTLYQMALQTSARMLNLSLLDYIK